jgi:hypothetical protein
VSTAQVVQVLSHAWPWLLWILVVPMLKIASAAAWVLSLWAAGVPADERHRLMVDAARRALRLRNPSGDRQGQPAAKRNLDPPDQPG